jgi:hypothetical protein
MTRFFIFIWRAAMFVIDRAFSQRNLDTGVMEWFFDVREGVYGPYSSKEQTSKLLKEFIKHHMAMGDDGGRIKKEQKRLSIMPKEYPVAAKHFDPSKKKKGVESL